MLDQAKVSGVEVEQLASRLGLRLYRTCVKDDLNVKEIFNDLGMEFIRRGGEHGLGVNSVTAIEDVGTKNALGEKVISKFGTVGRVRSQSFFRWG